MIPKEVTIKSELTMTFAQKTAITKLEKEFGDICQVRQPYPNQFIQAVFGGIAMFEVVSDGTVIDMITDTTFII